MDEMIIKLDKYHAISLMAFLMEFEKDFEGRENCTTIRNAINEFTEAVCMQTNETELLTTIEQKLKADTLLGWVPNSRPYPND